MATMGLFTDPTQLQEARLMQQAQMDPNQRLYMMAARGGQQLGQGVGSLFGVDVQDPAIARATKLRELGAKYGTTTAEALDKIAQELQATDPQMAMQVAEKANELRLTSGKIKAAEALTAQRTAAANKETKLATPADIVKAQRIAALRSAIPAYEAAGETATAKQLKDELDALLPADKTITYGAEAERVSQELYKKPFSQLTQPEMAAVNKRVDESAKKGTTVNVSVSGQKAFSEKMGELDAKKVADAMSARDNASATIRSLDQLAKLDDQGLISGSFASGRVGATNLLNTLGLTSPADQQRLANSQNYQKVAGDVILGTLGGKLGAGFSNEDRKFIEGLVPQLETSPAARRQLINFMRRKNMEIAEEAGRLESYARQNDGLKGFQPKIPLGGNVPVSGMTADDLARAAGGKIVNGKFVPNK